MRRLLDFLRRNERLVLPGAAFLLAALALFPRLGGYGLWDQQEITVADTASDLADNGGHGKLLHAQAGDSLRAHPPLTLWATALGAAGFGKTELGARLPLALLGLIAALAVYAAGARLFTRRAGLLAVVALISSPLFLFQSRQLTSDIGGVAGAALALLGFAGLLAGSKSDVLALALDGSLAVFGLVLGLFSCGLLVGVAAPLAGLAAAGLATAGRTPTGPAPRRPLIVGLVALAATLAAAVVLFLTVYDVVPAQARSTALLGKTVAASPGYHWILGGVWQTGKPAATATFDVIINQVAFGMFPLSALAPVAVLALLLRPGKRRGPLLLVFASVATYVAATIFIRKVGDLRYPGLPAIALAVGVFLDDAIPSAAEREPALPNLGLGLPIAALFVACAAVQLARDAFQFPDEIAAIHVWKQIKYPKEAGLTPAFLVFGIPIGLALAAGLFVGRASELRRRIAAWSLGGAAALAALFGLYLSLVFTPRLSEHFSYKNVFESYFDHRKAGEPLGVLGIAGAGPKFYARGEYQPLKSLSELVSFLSRPERVFAISPSDKLCAIHQQSADGAFRYHVLDARNSRFLLFSNQLGGDRDENPLLKAFRTEPPASFQRAVTANFDDKIDLLGVDMPESVGHGDSFQVTLWFLVKQRVNVNYKIFVHFDGRGVRFQGDHEPIGGRCGTTYWQPGAIVADTFTVTAGEMTHPRGSYDVWMGFFTGGAGQWRNMTVRSDNKDTNNRVNLGKIRVR